MTTVHIENTVQDFNTWKANFDKYERFRAEQGVQSYRVSEASPSPKRCSSIGNSVTRRPRGPFCPSSSR